MLLAFRLETLVFDHRIKNTAAQEHEWHRINFGFLVSAPFMKIGLQVRQGLFLLTEIMS